MRRDNLCPKQGDHTTAASRLFPTTRENYMATATKPKTKKKAVSRKPKNTNGRAAKWGVPKLCLEIQQLQRQRVVLQKSRIMFDNRLIATVGSSMGHHASEDEKVREKNRKEAQKVIDAVLNEKPYAGKFNPQRVAPLVHMTVAAMQGFLEFEEGLDEGMIELASHLPIAPWFDEIEQRGVGLISLAKIVGESGDIGNYSNKSKLWARMGCAPFSSQGETHMGGGWRRNAKKLTAAEWEKYGQSKRRRSVMYVITDGLIKLNKPGPYWKRYSDLKTAHGYERYDTGKINPKTEKPIFAWRKFEPGLHDDWTQIHVELHCKLLAGKLFLKEFWKEWQRRK
jgi:hypothetical protein